MANRTALLMVIAALVAALAAVTAALALSSGGEPPDTKAARQRVAIVTHGVQNDPAHLCSSSPRSRPEPSSATRAQRSRASPDTSRCGTGRGSS
jgi:hypothetical protein